MEGGTLDWMMEMWKWKRRSLDANSREKNLDGLLILFLWVARPVFFPRLLLSAIQNGGEI